MGSHQEYPAEEMLAVIHTHTILFIELFAVLNVPVFRDSSEHLSY